MRTSFFILLLLLLWLLAGCNFERNNPPTAEQTVQAMREYVIAAGIFSDSFEESDNAARDADNQLGSLKQFKTGFPVITIEPFDQHTWPKTITVDWGSENYLCQDNRYRRGKIIIMASDYYRNENSVLTINFDNFYQNNHKVEGNETVTNTGRNTDGFIVHTVVVSNGKITTPENKYIYFTQNSERTWIEGESTITEPCDDVYLIAGCQTGISSDSIHYEINVEESLNALVCCKWFRSGLLHVTIEDLPLIEIDYGETDCNNQAVVSFNGVDYPIEMQ
ncbi:MAG: hypothetical protein KBB11_01580 [Bacteroidales bacterium]|nr:hypothetical protein [Bacteroidales bacterium]HOY37942.1 hypothetical protein [Bacteroidales bacterium]HQP03201.1 hypothetical protein [Bacteroidales bacterium]